MTKCSDDIKKLRSRIFHVIQLNDDSDIYSKIFNYFIVIVIAINLLATLLSTFDQCVKYDAVFDIIELISVLIFTVEYLMRLWTADFLYPHKTRGAAIAAFALSFFGIIDLLTFLPYYLPIFFPAGVVAFRMFRVIRIFRLFRINARYDAFNIIIEVIGDKKNQIISSMVIIFIFLIAASLCMYDVEHAAQPEVFKNAFSGMWWAVSALLTVGYGDIYPITPLGQALAIVIAFLGVGMVAIPTGIISAGFVAEYTKIKTYSASEHELQFVISDVGADHSISNKRVKDIPFPPGLLLVMIIREDKPIVPKGDTLILEGDRLVIGARNYHDDIDITLKEVLIDEDNLWIGKRVRELDLPDDELLIMLHRKGRTLVPNGNTVICRNDKIVIFKNIRI